MWGPWAMGMATTNIRLKAKFEAVGLHLLEPHYGLTLLEQFLACNMSGKMGAQFTSEHFALHTADAKPMSMERPCQSLLPDQVATPMVRTTHVRSDNIFFCHYQSSIYVYAIYICHLAS